MTMSEPLDAIVTVRTVTSGGNRTINKPESREYFSKTIGKREVVQVMRLYFQGLLSVG